MGDTDAMAETPLGALRDWEAAGAHWRLVQLTDEHAVVELLTCLGEPAERLESGDAELLAHLRRRPSSEH